MHQHYSQQQLDQVCLVLLKPPKNKEVTGDTEPVNLLIESVNVSESVLTKETSHQYHVLLHPAVREQIYLS